MTKNTQWNDRVVNGTAIAMVVILVCVILVCGCVVKPTESTPRAPARWQVVTSQRVDTKRIEPNTYLMVARDTDSGTCIALAGNTYQGITAITVLPAAACEEKR